MLKMAEDKLTNLINYFPNEAIPIESGHITTELVIIFVELSEINGCSIGATNFTIG